jgi:hypothetical protein
MKKRSGLLSRGRVLPETPDADSTLAAALRESDSELAAQSSIIEAKRREIEAIRSRYEQDRSRYIALTEPRPFPR